MTTKQSADALADARFASQFNKLGGAIDLRKEAPAADDPPAEAIRKLCERVAAHVGELWAPTALAKADSVARIETLCEEIGRDLAAMRPIVEALGRDLAKRDADARRALTDRLTSAMAAREAAEKAAGGHGGRQASDARSAVDFAATGARCGEAMAA